MLQFVADSPLVEPPILELSSPGGIEDVPIVIFLSASVSSGNTTITDSDELVVYVTQYPEGAAFNKGTYNGTVWSFNSTEFGELKLSLPEHFSGSIVLLVIASHRGISREGSLSLVVEPVADPPTLTIEEVCYEPSVDIINLTIASSLVDQDGSESLVIIVANVPDIATLSVGQVNENGEYIVELEELHELSIELVQDFEPFNITVSALSTEEMNSDNAYTNVSIFIDFCSSTGKYRIHFQLTNLSWWS